MTGLRGQGDVSTSDLSPGVPVVEISATSLREEARSAVAVVSGLRNRGVRVRDIAVVARDLASYEEPLTSAAVRYDVPPAFWTQIRLTETRPFRLVVSVCELFAGADLDRDVLFRPLELGWSPLDPTDTWPIPARALLQMYAEAPKQSMPIDQWRAFAHNSECVDSRLVEFIEWVATQPAPAPGAITDVLGPLVEAYREFVLPVQNKRDSPALLATETAARAVVRTETLLTQVQHKYAQRVTDGLADRSWMTIAGLCDSVASQRPGRREHANAVALDILEANDIWARRIPYVVAVGLVDGTWPQQPQSVVPATIQTEVFAGEGAARHLSPRLAWTEGRDLDQFVDVLQATTGGLIVTRHTHDLDGVRQPRSPLLEQIDAESIDQAARHRLLSTAQTLPEPIESMLHTESSQFGDTQ